MVARSVLNQSDIPPTAVWYAARHAVDVCCAGVQLHGARQTTNVAVQVPEQNVSWMGVERRYIV
jgi:hypothetical protein